MAAGGFTVSTQALNAMAQSFDGAAPALTQNAGPVSATSSVDTGDAALNALVARLAGQVAASMTGAGQAMQAVGNGLRTNASNYTRADQAGTPASPGGPAGLG
jgi:Family of unknown function (DUF6317)